MKEVYWTRQDISNRLCEQCRGDGKSLGLDFLDFLNTLWRPRCLYCSRLGWPGLSKPVVHLVRGQTPFFFLFQFRSQIFQCFFPTDQTCDSQFFCCDHTRDAPVWHKGIPLKLQGKLCSPSRIKPIKRLRRTLQVHDLVLRHPAPEL